MRNDDWEYYCDERDEVWPGQKDLKRKFNKHSTSYIEAIENIMKSNAMSHSEAVLMYESEYYRRTQYDK